MPKLSDEEIQSVVDRTTEVLMDDFAEDLMGDWGANGPEISNDLLERLTKRSIELITLESHLTKEPR